MVQEAERFKAEDERQREKIAARNSLEGLIVQYKQATNDAGNKLSKQEKKNVLGACDDMQRWIDSNSLAEKDEIEYKTKTLEQICQPIMTKLFREADKSGPQQYGQPMNSYNYRGGPTVEEVD